MVGTLPLVIFNLVTVLAFDTGNKSCWSLDNIICSPVLFHGKIVDRERYNDDDRGNKTGQLPTLYVIIILAHVFLG